MGSGKVLFELPIRNEKDIGGAKDGQIVCTQPAPQVYLITFTSPPDNRLVTDFCRTFILALDIIEHRYPPGVVITTSGIPKFYSNGMDIEHAMYTAMYIPNWLYGLFHRLLTYSRPTIALFNGHAFAGGFMLGMAHDYRVMNPHKGYLCLNEIELGMPLHPAMTAIFRQKTHPSTYRKVVLEAHRFKALEALQEGLIDHIGSLPETLTFISEMALTKKAAPGMSGAAVYSELKREMWAETIGKLKDWAGESVTREKGWENVREEGKKSLGRVVAWEGGSVGKAKL